MGCAMCRSEQEEYFISISDFKSKNSDKKFIAIDCSTGDDAEAKYKLHRIADAQFLGQKWSVAAPPKSIKDCMDKLGVGTDSNVVCYDNVDGTQAMTAAAFMHACGIKSVQVLAGKFADDKDNKKAEKDQDAVKKAAGTGAAWVDLPATFFFSNVEMNKVQSGAIIELMIDMRPAADFKKTQFHKCTSNMEMDKIWARSTNSTVTQATIDKLFSDMKFVHTEKMVILGGGADAAAMMWCLTSQGCKKVAIYTASLEEHEVMLAAAKKAADEKKAADAEKKPEDKKGDDKPADDKKPVETKPADDKPAEDTKPAEKPAEDTPKAEEKPAEDAPKTEAPAE